MSSHHSPSPRKPTLVELRAQIRQGERRSPAAETTFYATGCDSLDALFPGRGVRRGSLVEWIGAGPGSGAGTLALLVGRQVCRNGGPLVLVDARRRIFPLALAALGFDLASLVIVRPESERMALWACEEALRCKAVGGVWIEIEQVSPLAFRRLQLAAEAAETVGFLLRPAQALRQPSWADVRLWVQPCPTQEASPRVGVEAIYSHGQTTCSSVDLTIDYQLGTIHDASSPHETPALPLVS